MSTNSTVIPCMRYKDVPAAIDWLCDTFGFEKQLIVPGEGNEIAHAQLRHGNGMIMLGSVTDTEFGQLMKQPDEIGVQRLNARTLLSVMPMPSTIERSWLVQESLLRSRMRTMEAVVSAATILKVTCGTSAHTTPGSNAQQVAEANAKPLPDGCSELYDYNFDQSISWSSQGG
jgi:hypothetical protein